jgi:hypothetical protein
LPFLDDLRLERALAVARNADLDGADVGQHRLGAAAVTRVTAVLAGWVALVIAEVVVDLPILGELQDPLRELL